MNSLQLLLLDLVEMSETPLYSAYSWLNRQVGHDISLRSFLLMVSDLLESNVLSLWSIDNDNMRRVKLPHIEDNLETRYAQIDHTDSRYDPFGLSITLGPQANPNVDPEWAVDFNFEAHTFRIQSRYQNLDLVLRSLRDYFPDLELRIEKEVSDDGRLIMLGHILQR